MSKDYYKILEVDRNASDDEIKKSYRKMAKKYHPDKNQGSKEHEEKFKECAEAFEVLSDPEKKNQYDQFGTVGNGPNGGGFNPEDIFNHFGDIFGGGRQPFGFGRGGKRSQVGGDLRIKVTLTLQDVINGISKKIKYTRQCKCSSCDGKGGKNPVSCVTCNGSGVRTTVQQSPFGHVRQVVTCQSCNGDGETIRDKCTTCRGSGLTPKEESVDINIPRGAINGMYLTLEGYGNYAKNGSPGDLQIAIEEIPDPKFQRQDSDLYYAHNILLVDSIIGSKNQIITPKGKVDVSIKPGTQHGSVIRVSGMGVPKINGGVGDLLIKVSVKVPTSLNSKEMEILNTLKSMPNFK